MVEITTIAAIGIVVYIIYTYFYKTKDIDFIQVILFIISISTAYFSYYSRQVQEEQLITDLTDKLTLGVYDRIMKEYPYSLEFYNSIHKKLNIDDKITSSNLDNRFTSSFTYTKTNIDTIKQSLVSFSLSVELIDMIIYFIGKKNVLKQDTYNSWILTFRMWFDSDILQDAWKKVKNIYPDSLTKFIENDIIAK